MKLTTAKRICKRLSNQYGIINPPELIPLKYSRRGNHAALGSYDSDQNIVEINKYAMELWNTERIQEIIQHELIHARCYQDFGHCGHGRGLNSCAISVALKGMHGWQRARGGDKFCRK